MNGRVQAGYSMRPRRGEAGPVPDLVEEFGQLRPLSVAGRHQPSLGRQPLEIDARRLVGEPRRQDGNKLFARHHRHLEIEGFKPFKVARAGGVHHSGIGTLWSIWSR